MQLVTGKHDFDQPDESLQDHNVVWLVSTSEPTKRMFVCGTCAAYLDGDEVHFAVGSAVRDNEIVVLSAHGGSPGFRKLLSSIMPQDSRADRDRLATVLKWYDFYVNLEGETSDNV